MDISEKNELTQTEVERIIVKAINIGDEYLEKDFTSQIYCEVKKIELYFNSNNLGFLVII